MREVTDEFLSSFESRMTTKQEAARRQITIAIKLFFEGEYECVITLAGAAEGQMENGEAPHVFEVLKSKRPAEVADNDKWIAILNETVYWLKHKTPQLPQVHVIYQFEAAIMLLRSISKYYSVYQEEVPEMGQIETWCQAKGIY